MRKPSGSARTQVPNTVAVLGTGTMGAAMAANIAKAGLGLRVWNREKVVAEVMDQARDGRQRSWRAHRCQYPTTSCCIGILGRVNARWFVAAVFIPSTG